MIKALQIWLSQLKTTELKLIYLRINPGSLYYRFKRMYKYDLLRFLIHSRTLDNNSNTKLISEIILQYHVLEKGLTMPDCRLGFGRNRLLTLCNQCITYIEKYGQDDEQLNHAIGVILEYERYHLQRKYKLDTEITNSIESLLSFLEVKVKKSSQITIKKDEYFKHTQSSFPDFSNSRSSLRNYSDEDIPITKIENSLELARNTPSACNRQCWRTYVYTNKEKINAILEAQGGNRGFGHLANKLIVITGEIGVFAYTNERYQVYIDCGLYAMNLLYALHNNEIGTCILNCSFDYEKEMEVKKICSIKESEVLTVMIACGSLPEEFSIASSPRYSIQKTNKIIN